MPLIFSYGTLQREGVQVATFSRRLPARPAMLAGFVLSRVTDDRVELSARGKPAFHANVVASGRADSRVSGSVLEVTNADLALADKYEHSASYVRIAVQLVSGENAWVYVHGPSLEALPTNTDTG
jgi:hypothetical protein